MLASETIGRRNVAAVDPDRLQTRCRVGGARAGLPDNQTGLDCGTGQPRRRAILIGNSKMGVSRCVTAQQRSSSPLPGKPHIFAFVVFGCVGARGSVGGGADDDVAPEYA
jgi:hypothetical protein